MKKYNVRCEHFNFPLAISYAIDIVEMMNNGEYDDLEQAVFETINSQLIYNCDLWDVMIRYQTPDTADLERALLDFEAEIFRCIQINL